MAALASSLAIVSAIEALVPVGVQVGHAIALLINKDGSVTPVILLNNTKGDAMKDMADITQWYISKGLKPPNGSTATQEPVAISSIVGPAGG